VTPEQEADALLLHAAIAGLPALTRANGGPPAGHAALVRRLQRMADDLSVSRSRLPFGSMAPVAVSRCGCRLAAEIVGVSARQIERYVSAGRLDAERIGGTLVLGERQVRELAEERRRNGRGKRAAEAA
jgi:hypothetical protein